MKVSRILKRLEYGYTPKKDLTERGVTLSGGGSRKADLIQKVLADNLLQLPTLPSQEEKKEGNSSLKAS